MKPGDFAYLDPPFSVGAQRVFHEYDATAFGADDLKRLRRWMKRLDNIGVAFLVSFAESAEANYLRRGFHARRVQVRRSIAGFTASRVRVRHRVLILNRLPCSEDREE